MSLSCGWLDPARLVHDRCMRRVLRLTAVGRVRRAVAVAGVVLAACGCSASESATDSPSPEKTAPAPTDSLPVGQCPQGRNPGNIDYANYVMYGGRMYVNTDLDVTVPPGQLGDVLASVRCSIDERNGNFWFVPRDLDAAFLRVGAPLRAIDGMPVEQQIAGQWRDGRWVVFSVEASAQ